MKPILGADRFVNFAFSLVLACSLFACQSGSDGDATRLTADKPATAELNRVNTLLASNRPVTRVDIDSLNSLRERYPASAVVRQLLQGALIKRGDWAAAEKVIGEIPDNERTNSERLNLAKIYFKQGKFSEATDLLKRMSPDAAEFGLEIPTLLGQSQFYAGNLDEAVAALEPIRDTLVLQKRADNLALLGTIYLRQGDHRKAIEILEKAVEVSPDNISSNNALSRAYAATGDETRAQSVRERLQAINERVAVAEKKSARRVALFYQLEDAYAAKDFEKVIALVGQIQPDADDAVKPTLYQYLAAAYQAQGKETEAKNARAEAAKLTPK